MLGAIVATTVAAAGILAAVEESPTAGFFTATVVAASGSVPGCRVRSAPSCPRRHRGNGPACCRFLYVVSYCGMGVPAITAGVLVVHSGGLSNSARDHALLLIVLAAAALAGLLRNLHHERSLR